MSAAIAEQLEAAVIALGIIAGVFAGERAWWRLRTRLIRRLPAQSQTATVPAVPSAPAPAAAPNSAEEKSVNWFAKYVVGPVVAFFSGLASSDNPQVVAAKQTLATAGQADLAAVNPLLNDFTLAIETASNTLLSGLGAVGTALEIPADLVIQVASSVGAQAIDHALGINPLPASPAAATTTAAASTASTGIAAQTSSATTAATLEPDGYAAPKTT